MIILLNLYFNIFDNLPTLLKIFIQIIYIFLLTFLISNLIKYALFYAFKYFLKSRDVDNKIITMIKKDLMFVISLACFVEITDVLTIKLDENLIIEFNRYRFFVIYILILTFLLKLINQAKQYYILKKEKYNYIVDYSDVDALEKLSKIIIIVLWAIIALGKLGINLNALLAFGGAGGIMLGFASRDLFANIFGGLMIYLDKPFAVGDWIASPDRNIEGDVEFIGWRQTRILTFDKYPIYIPNSIFSSIIIQNIGRIRSRRIVENIYVRYVDTPKMDKITKEVKEMLQKSNNINKSYTLLVSFSNFSNGMATLYIYTYTNTTEFVRFYEIKQDVLLKIYSIIKENGAEVAENTSNLLIKDKID